MGPCNKCLAKSGGISKPCITMMLVVGLKNAGLIGKQLVRSVLQGIHQDPENIGCKFQANWPCHVPGNEWSGCLLI